MLHCRNAEGLGGQRKVGNPWVKGTCNGSEFRNKYDNTPRQQNLRNKTIRTVGMVTGRHRFASGTRAITFH